MATFGFIVTSVSVTIFVLTEQAHFSPLDGDNNYLDKFGASVKSFSEECRKSVIGSNNTDEMAELTDRQLCSHVKSERLKTSILVGCSQDEYRAIIALMCSMTDGLGRNESSTALNKDKDFMRRWVNLVKSLFLECRRFILDKNLEAIGELTHEAACRRLKSDYKNSILEACSLDEFRSMVGTVCNSSTILNEDKDFLKRWNALTGSFPPECTKYTTNSSIEPIGDLTRSKACSLVKSKSFKRNALEGCSQDEYGTIVAFVCRSGGIDESGYSESSTSLNDDKVFNRRWLALVASFSPKCREFSYKPSMDLIGKLTHKAACRHVKADSFKSIVLQTCSHDEYDAGVDLVCSRALKYGKTRHHGGRSTLHGDQRFVKVWVDFLRTLSPACRSFAIISSTGPVADLPPDAACRHFKSDSLKSSALEVCSHEEYVAAEGLVCRDSGSIPLQKLKSSTPLNNDTVFTKSWVALMESLPEKCKRFILYSNRKAVMDLTREAACRRVASNEFRKHAVESCSLDEYDSVVQLICPNGSSHVYLAYTTLLLCFSVFWFIC